MESKPLNIFSFELGFFSTDHFRAPRNSFAPGSKNLFILGQDTIRAFRGFANGPTQGSNIMFQTANGYAGLNDFGGDAFGSVFNFIGESLWFVGNGYVFVNGEFTTFITTTNIQLAPKVGDGYPQAYTAGLAQPIAPTITPKEPSSGFSGIMNGVYSFKIARVRSLTGAVSIASPTSQVVTFTNQTAVLQFPPASSNGQDRWAIFGTKQGFGGTGVHYLVKEISETDLSTIGGLTRAYELEYVDSDLLAITAYTDDYPPPACLFAAVLESYILAIGCYENCIAVSNSNFPESFNPDNLLYLPKSPTAILQSAIGSYLYIATKTTVHAVSITGDTNQPLAIQTLWSNVGILKQHNWCAIEGVIFAFVSEQGAITMNALGQPDNTFALPVSKELSDWDPEDTFVFYDPRTNYVLYSNKVKGKVLCFNLQNRKWSTPIMATDFSITGGIVAGVVVDRTLKLTFKNGSILNAYDWDQGTGNVTWVAQSPFWTESLARRMNIHGIKPIITHAAVDAGGGDGIDPKLLVTAKLFGNNNLGSPLRSIVSSTIPGTNFFPRSSWFLPRLESVSVSLEATTNSNIESLPVAVPVYGTLEDERI